MLDLGGAPSSMNKKNVSRLNTNKNCHVQAICFDFECLTRSVDSAERKEIQRRLQEEADTSELENVSPNVGAVQELAELLQVDLGAAKKASRPEEEGEEDDLSLLLGESSPKEEKPAKQHSIRSSPPGSDIRAKYAAKLHMRGVEGGIAGVNLANSAKQDALKLGDAAGHMAARKIAVSEPVGPGRWMAKTGTGTLLQYLTQRSMKLVLLPKPTEEIDMEEGRSMDEFKKQLSQVVFDLLNKDGSLGAAAVSRKSLDFLELDPNAVMLVSDRDEYLRAANDLGMVTCRVRPENARRGNISAHYNVQEVKEVKEVINEINGISYNAVLKSR